MWAVCDIHQTFTIRYMLNVCWMCSAGVRSGQSLVEIAVLASQPLTALRDAIECEADVNLASQHQSRPAGFFYIEVTQLLLLSCRVS